METPNEMKLTSIQMQIVAGRQHKVKQLEVALRQAKDGLAETLALIGEVHGVDLLDKSHFIDENGVINVADA